MFAVCMFASTLFGAVVIHVNHAVSERKGQVAVAETQHAPSKARSSRFQQLQGELGRDTDADEIESEATTHHSV